MFSFHRLALLLALGLPALSVVQAQSSSSNPPSPAADQAQAPPATATQSGQATVQARIRARREQRRAAAIHEVYSHRYEAYLGSGYRRFTPGATLQRLNEYSWNAGFTRYFDERLGVTLDARGTYGSAFIPPMANNLGISKPAISQYTGLIGPTYRFYVQPKYSVSGRVMGGVTYGNFSGDTNGSTDLATYLGLYKDATTYSANAGIVGEYNLTPKVGLRVAPDYLLTGFGSTEQHNLGFTAGIVYRFGKQ
jgi:hypothetical protein